MERLSLLKLNEYIINIEKAKELDNKAFVINKIPPSLLMEEAATLIYERLKRNFNLSSHKIALIAGSGNNGGDGLAVARKILFNDGIKIDIFIFENRNESELFKLQKDILKTLDFNFINVEKLKDLIGNYTLIIDAIFGIGYKYRDDILIDEIFSVLNNSNTTIVAIDIPSGLNSDNRKMIKSDLTYSIGFLKEELFNINSRKYCGIIENIKISFDINNINLEKNYYIDINSYKFENKKNNFVNKYSKGSALFIGGSSGKAGSIIFSALSALRSGSGISLVLTNKGDIPLLNSISPEVVIDSIENIDHYLDKYSTIAVGPGLSISQETMNILKNIFYINKQFILDASFFSNFDISILNEFSKPPILTPHTGEFKRFFGNYYDSLCKKTVLTVREICKKFNIYLILKDVDIIIGTPKEEVIVIDNPNRLLSTAGSGDILCGLITGFISQGFSEIESILNAIKIFYTIGNFYLKNNYISYRITDFIDKISYWEDL